MVVIVQIHFFELPVIMVIDFKLTLSPIIRQGQFEKNIDSS